MADSIAIAELTMKLTELENEYEIYKEKTELELIELKDKNNGYEENRETEDVLREQLLEKQFNVTQLEEQISKLKEQHKSELEHL
jgi:hypothetical protein